MICTSIQDRNLDGIWEALESSGVEMAEIRLDSCHLTGEEIEELFSFCDLPLVATCRISEHMPAQTAESRLLAAIHAGAQYVDLEMEAPPMMSKRIRRETREYGVTLIRSYHDFQRTDSVEALKALVEKCQRLGADIVKIVTTAVIRPDANRVLSLYDEFEPAGLIAFCMGEMGRESRLECLRKGAPFTYAALNDEEATAPGQWTTLEMSSKIYGGLRMIGYDSMTGETPSLRMPSSKSYAQRAIIAAALADGESRLSGYTPCGDSESAIEAAKAIGAKISREKGAGKTETLSITGIGASFGGLDITSLHTGESGLLTRLMIPLMAGLSKNDVLITGEKTLLNRPLKGAGEIMSAFGVSLESEKGQDEEKDGEHGDVHIPLDVKGTLKGCDASISGKDGSQIISGLLAALPLAKEDSHISVINPKSIPYLFITIEILKRFGIKIDSELEGGQEFMETQDWNLCDRINFRIRGGQKYTAADITLEGDWSSAANFLVGGAVFGEIDIEGLENESLQADLSIVDILAEAGAAMSRDEDSGAVHVQRAPLRAIDIDASNCPDLFPIVSILAAFCQGTSHISGVKRLAAKESDRGKAIVDMLTKMGVVARIKNDTLSIQGHSLCQRLLSGTLLKGGEYESRHDHRMVMALKMAQFGADSPIVPDDTECVKKSFPSFFELYKKL